MFLQNYKKNYIITLVDASENETENNICMNGFAHHQFLLVDKDGYAISQETKEMPFFAGDVIYVAAGRRFGIRSEGRMRIRHIAFTGRNIRPLLHYCHFNEFRITSTPAEKNYISSMFDKIFNLKTSSSSDKHMHISASLYSLLASLGEINIENDNHIYSSKELLLRPVIDFMQENYRNPLISYDRLISSLDISASELDNLFVDVFSLPTAEFYKKLRMENAKHLLFFYAASGTEYISANMGYSDVSEFERDFYAQFHMSSDEFVKLYYNK